MYHASVKPRGTVERGRSTQSESPAATSEVTSSEGKNRDS